MTEPTPTFVRFATFDGAADQAALTIPVVLSTEHPVDRGDYVEILSHDPADVDLSRARPSLPMLEAHNQKLLPIGVIENVRLEGRKLRGVARFSQRARALFEDAKNGILNGVSVGYNLLTSQPAGKGVLRFSWMPIEASIVAVAADPAAGFNRGQDMDITRSHAEALISGKLREIAGLKTAAGMMEPRPPARASLARWALVAIQPGSREIYHPSDIEYFEATQKRAGWLAGGTPVWSGHGTWWDDVLPGAMRALGKSPGSKGGFAVGVDTIDAVDTPRAASIVETFGVPILTDLQSDILIPTVATTVTASWVGENTAGPSESPPTLGASSMTPKQLVAFIDASIPFIKQGGPAVERLLRMQVERAALELLDKAFLAGAGGQVPLGLLNTANIGTQSGTSLAHAGLLAMRKACLNAGAHEDSLRWVGAPAVEELLGARVRETGATGSGRFLWDDNGILGKPALATKNAPASALVVGDFAQALIGVFGPGVRIDIDPSQGFNTASLRLRVMLLCDCSFPQPSAFTVATSIT